MIVGGSNQYPKSLNSVELFNWQTGEKCRLANLPVSLQGHSGVNFINILRTAFVRVYPKRA